MKTELLRMIEGEVLRCRACRLCETATHAVPGDGSSQSGLLFVGEAPGAHEDAQGKPFVGRAGKLLDELFASISLKREDVYITNIIKHRPPGNRDPLPDEIAACRHFLDQQLQALQPRLVVTLGRFGYTYFVPDGKISRDHGVVRSMGAYRVFPVYHPAAALRNGGMDKALREDFSRIPHVLALQETQSVSSHTIIDNQLGLGV